MGPLVTGEGARTGEKVDRGKVSQHSLLKLIQAREMTCFHIFIEHHMNIKVQGGKRTWTPRLMPCLVNYPGDASIWA